MQPPLQPHSERISPADRAYAIIATVQGRLGLLLSVVALAARYFALGNFFLQRLGPVMPFGWDPFLLVAALGVGLILWAMIKGLPPPRNEFFENRPTLNKFRGGIRGEVEKAQEIWIAWATGRVASVEGILRSEKLTRALLLSPEHPHLAEYAAMIPGFTKAKHQEDIETATDILISRMPPPQVGWVTGHLIFLTIGDPNNLRTGWARVDDYFSEQGRPSYIVYRAKQPWLFQEIINYYDAVFEKAERKEPAPAIVVTE